MHENTGILANRPARQDGRPYGASRLPQGKFEQGAGSFDKTARLSALGSTDDAET